MISLQAPETDSKSAFSIFGVKPCHFFVFSILLLLFIFSFSPANAVEIIDAPDYSLLVSNESAVLQIGDVYKFQQGYEVVIKGSGAGTILIEIYNNNTDGTDYFIETAALKEGETVQCSRRTENDTNLIFMMTLESTYLNNSGVIADFSHIYQYNDPAVDKSPMSPNWVIYTDTLESQDPPLPNNKTDPDNKTDTNNKTDTDDKNQPEFSLDPIYIILGVGLIAVLAVLLNLIQRRKRPAASRKKAVGLKEKRKSSKERKKEGKRKK
jgi:hypothetical protein